MATGTVRKGSPKNERIRNHQEILQEFGYDAESALSQAERIVLEDIRYKFMSDQVPGSFMFQVTKSVWSQIRHS